MIGRQLVVAAALLTCLTKVAAASDNNPGHPSNAQKALVILGYIGINNPDVRAFITEMDTHVKGSYFNLSERNVPGGKLTLHYQFKADGTLPAIGRRRGFELQYKLNDDSLPLTVGVKQNSAVVGMHWKF